MPAFEKIGLTTALVANLAACKIQPTNDPNANTENVRNDVFTVWGQYGGHSGKCTPSSWKKGESPPYPLMVVDRKGKGASEDAIWLGHKTTSGATALDLLIAKGDGKGYYEATCPTPGVTDDFVILVSEGRVLINALGGIAQFSADGNSDNYVYEGGEGSQ